MTEPVSTTITLPVDIDPAMITGTADELLRLIQNSFESRITMRGNQIEVYGDEAESAAVASLFDEIIRATRKGMPPDSDQVKRFIELIRSAEMSPQQLRDDVLLTHRGRAIRPKTPGQKHYIDTIRHNTITFGIGPAGTGKTYLAMAMAVAALERGDIARIILSRPIVEAGENLGFLPGTLTEKVDPYIRPLYDALYDMVDAARANTLIDQGIIEIAPLAFMRGRTLNESFIILDEAQNTTREQMKMFLTRLGFASKMVVTGDTSQTDLPHGATGLLQAQTVLEGIDHIAFCRFAGRDVVRNSLVAAIVEAYEQAKKQA